MKKRLLEARLGNKTLTLGRQKGKRLDLDASLCDAEQTSNEGVNYLTLVYDSKQYMAEEEAEKIYDFLGKQNLPKPKPGLRKPIEVSESPEDEPGNSVTLYGEFDAKVYRR